MPSNVLVPASPRRPAGATRPFREDWRDGSEAVHTVVGRALIAVLIAAGLYALFVIG